MTPEDPTSTRLPPDPASLAALAATHTQGDAAAAAPAAGEVVIAGYRIEAELARGGMGVVYRAIQLGLNRPVALKMILGGNRADGKHLIRFLAEAEVVAAIKHPHVVQVFEYGEHACQPFMAMEFCPNGTLADRLRVGRIDPVSAAELVEKLSKAVQAAHDLGIVHRDLKPGNVLFDKDGEPKIADFGLARRGAGSNLTRTQAVMGTPSYMSPEQARGDNKFVGPAADLWALGVILYECLTAMRPFESDDNWAILQKVMNDNPMGVRKRSIAVPRDLELICMKCLRKETGERYASAQALTDDLRAFREGRPIAARPIAGLERLVKWARRNPGYATLSAGLIVALVAGTVISSAQAVRANREAARAERSADEAIELATAETKAKDLARAQEAEARRLLAAAATTEALRLADIGDLAAAQLWFAEAIRRDPGDTATVTANRVRLDQFNRLNFKGYCLTNVVHADGTVAAFSGDHSRYVTIHDEKTMRIWDAKTRVPLTPEFSQGGIVVSAVFSPDGTRLATYGEKIVRIWDTATGEPTIPPIIHNGNVVVVDFSSDTSRLATGCDDGIARVWDVSTGDPVTQPLVHAAPVRMVVIAADGKRVASGAQDGTARVWDARTGEALTPRMKHDEELLGEVTMLAFHPDGTKLATAGSDRTARIWDITTGRALTPPMRHQAWVNYVLFSPDGTRLATASMDQSARVWEVSSGAAVGPRLMHEDSVTSLVFSPDGALLATAGLDRTVRVWEVRSGGTFGPPLRHEDSISEVAFLEEGKRIITSTGEIVRTWDLRPEKPMAADFLSTIEGAAGATAFSPNSDRVAMVAQGRMAVRDCKSGQPIGVPLKLNNDESPLAATFSPDGSTLVVGCSNKTARIWDVKSGTALTPPLRHLREVGATDFSDDGMYVATGSEDKTAMVWNARTGEAITPPLRHDGIVNSVTFSPDGTLVATASDDKSARVWNSLTGEPVTPSLRHRAAVRTVVFSPDGTTVATASDDNTARLWNARTGEPSAASLLHSGQVAGIVFSPDGRRLATASYDRTARIWDARTGEALTPPLRHASWTWLVAFSSDGLMLATGTWDQTARVWEVTTGRPLTPPFRAKGRLGNMVFSANGHQLLLAGTELESIEIIAESRLLQTVTQLVELKSGHRIDRVGAMVALTSLEIADRWSALHSSQAAEFAAPMAPEQIRKWHLAEANSAELAKDWFAAAFHLRLLRESDAMNLGLQDRLDTAEKKLRLQEPGPSPRGVPEK